MTRDERRGRDANLGGKPYDPRENLDWQRGQVFTCYACFDKQRQEATQ